MTVRIIVKDEEGKKIISRITSRYIESLQAAPFYWRDSKTFIILGVQTEQSILDAIVDGAGREFFKHFSVEGYLTVGSWLNGKIVKAKDYVKERLGGE